MKKIGYAQYIMDNILNVPFSVPIYTKDIALGLAKQFDIELDKAKTLVNANLKRLADNNVLEHYQKGIYYKAQETPFGKTKLNPAYITRDMYLIKNGDIIGYETGPSLYNKMGLTTQLPKYRTYATNVFKHNGSRVDEKLGVILRRPPTEVTDINYRYLQLLDAIENKEKLPADALDPDQLILEYIHRYELDFLKLAGYASRYYRREVLLRLGELAAGVLQ